MSHRDLIHKSKRIHPHKAYVAPIFNEPTILVQDHFDYVSLWLKRNRNRHAELYWNQARNFYKATEEIPRESKPLTAYYCMMNAAKCLLTVKGSVIDEYHGLSGSEKADKCILPNELIEVKQKGVIPGLCKYYEASSILGQTVDLKNVLFNIPYIHRAFNISFSNSDNLFIPLSDPHFARSKANEESWFTAEIKDKQYQNIKILQKQRAWEIDAGEKGGVHIRSKRRFKWHSKGPSRKDNIKNLIMYHKVVRRDIKYIYGQTRLWYLKRTDKINDSLAWPTPCLSIMAMHRLSELCRYKPERLMRHYDANHNWILSEFIGLSLINFIDSLSCEITGQDLMLPGYRK